MSLFYVFCWFSLLHFIAISSLSNGAHRLAYLHEGLEPKVVHRDIKSSNILLDKEWTPKVSDFGLAKLLGSEHSYVTTRVMGTFGYVLRSMYFNSLTDLFKYTFLTVLLILKHSFLCSYVAPEYASTGMLNERNDVYSFGVLIMEILSGRSPVDYSRPPGEVCSD